MVSLREAVAEDEDTVYELAQGFPSPTSIDRESFSTTWNEKMDDDRSLVCVAEVSGILIGYAAGYMHRPFYANGATFWLDEVLVKEELRMSGIGKSLIYEVESWAKKKGCRQLLLASSRMGTFYETLGFDNTAEYFKKYL